ncbi:MAG: hypothetical protein WC761_00355 [Candidatus Paceibacterota bacterium]|jgi:hypothetical protein
MLNHSAGFPSKDFSVVMDYVLIEPGCQMEFSCRTSSHEDLTSVTGYSVEFLTLNTFHLVLDIVMHPRLGRIFLKVLDAGTEKVRFIPASSLQLARYVLDRTGKLHGPDGQPLTLWPYISSELVDALEKEKGGGLSLP